MDPLLYVGFARCRDHEPPPVEILRPVRPPDENHIRQLAYLGRHLRCHNRYPCALCVQSAGFVHADQARPDDEDVSVANFQHHWVHTGDPTGLADFTADAVGNPPFPPPPSTGKHMNPIALLGVSAGFASAALASMQSAPTSAIGRVHRRLVAGRQSSVAVASGLVGGASALALQTQPVGVRGADLVLTVLAIALVATGAARSSRTSLLIATTLAAGSALTASRSTPNLAVLLATIPFGVALVIRTLRPSPILRALIGPVFACGLAGLPTTLPTRVPSLIGVSAGLIVVVSGWRTLKGAARRRAAFAAATVTLLAIAAAGFGGLAALRSKTHAELAIGLAEGALGSAESLKTVDSAKQLEQAGLELDDALRALHAASARPAFLLPLVGPNLRAIESLASDARTLTTRAAKLAGRIDTTRLRPRDGAVDLDAYRTLGADVASVQVPLLSLTYSSTRVLRDPWVVQRLKERVGRFDQRLQRLDSEVSILGSAMRFLPNMLGGSGTRRYLLILPATSEARGSGGLIGNYGEIVVSDGKFQLSKFGRNLDLQSNGTPPILRKLDAQADYIARYSPFGVAYTWSNMNMSPDYPSAAEAMANHYPQSGGEPVDGVISVDPLALAAFLRLLGPVTVSNWPVPLTSENAAEVLLHDNYVKFDGDRDGRLAMLADTATGVWAALTGTNLPDPATLTTVLGPTARARHLQIWMRDAAEQGYLATLHLSGAVPPVAGDSFGLVVNNAGASKIDWFLHRTVNYDVSFDRRTGTATALATVTLRNDAPSTGEPDYVIGNGATDVALPDGTSRLYVSAYSSLPLESWLVDGRAIEFDRAKEVGHLVSSGWVVVPSGSTVMMQLRFGGAVPNGSDGVYRLDLFQQPLVRPDATSVRLRSASGEQMTPLAGWPAGSRGGAVLDARNDTGGVLTLTAHSG